MSGIDTLSLCNFLSIEKCSIYLVDKRLTFSRPIEETSKAFQAFIEKNHKKVEEIVRQTPLEYLDDSNDQTTSILTLSKSLGSTETLFCIHPLTGHFACYSKLVPHFPKSTAVMAVCPPNYSGAWELPSTMEEIAEFYASKMLTSGATQPYHLSGFSTGGLLAIEIARHFLKLGHKVGSLTLIDTILPSDFFKDSYDNIGSHKEFWKLYIGTLFGWRFTAKIMQMHEFTEMELFDKIQFLTNEARKHNQYAAFQDNSSLMHRYNNILSMSKLRAKNTISPLNHPISLIIPEGAEDHTYVSDWFKLALSNFKIFSTPGKHLTLTFVEKNAIAVANIIQNNIKSHKDHLGKKGHEESWLLV